MLSYWRVVEAGCAPAKNLEFPISNQAAVVGPARKNADEASTLEVWADKQLPLSDKTRQEATDYLAKYDELISMLREAMGAPAGEK